MDGIDRVMDQLENADYDTGGALVTWLRECVDGLDFAEAAERLDKWSADSDP